MAKSLHKAFFLGPGPRVKWLSYEPVRRNRPTVSYFRANLYAPSFMNLADTVSTQSFKEVRLEFALAPEDIEAAIERLAHEDTRLVSLTVTEGGYFIEEGTGEFLSNEPSIEHDVCQPESPITSLGLISAG